MNNEKIPLAEISLDDFFESRLYSPKEKIKAFFAFCAGIAKETASIEKTEKQTLRDKTGDFETIFTKPVATKPKKQAIKKSATKKYSGLSNGLNLILATKKPKKRA